MEEGIFEVWLKVIEKKVKDYVEKQNGSNIQHSMIDFSNEKNFRLSEQQPSSLFQLAAITLVSKDNLELNYTVKSK